MADEAHEQIHIDAPAADCFERASTFEDYPEWTNDVKQATVLARDAAGRGTRVEYRAAAMGRRVQYVLDYDFTDAPDAFSWSLVEGDMLRTLDGRYAFAPDGAGTRVDYRLRVDLSVPLPKLVKRRASALIVGIALRDLKRVVESGVSVSEPGIPASSERPIPGGERPKVEEHEMPDPADMGGYEPAPHPDAVDFEIAGTEERSLPAPSVLESVITELLGAVPEIRDHVLEAADSMLDAARALLDAADRVVRQQRGDE